MGYKTDKIAALVKNITGCANQHITPEEGNQIFLLALKAQTIPGDFAEVGVSKGTSARIICEAKGEKMLHLFDTFEGLPWSSKEDRFEQFAEGQYAVDVDEVKEFLKNYKNIAFHKGYFPKTADNLTKKVFAFLHFDGDLYQTAKDSLEFFYPRMSKGGFFLMHDYNSSEGVRKAVDGFFKDKLEAIDVVGSQCLVEKGLEKGNALENNL